MHPFKQLSVLKSVCLTLLLMLLFNCNNKNEAVDSKKITQISINNGVLKLINDSTTINPLVDSLKREFHRTYDTIQINILGDLSENWRPNALTFANEEFNQARKINYLKGEADALCKLGIYALRKFDFDSAIYFFNHADILAQKNNLAGIKAQSLSWQAEIFRQKGELENCISTQNEAIKICDPSDKKRLAFCHVSKAEAFRTEGYFDSAIVSYKKVIKYAEAINDVNKIIISYNGLGEVFRAQNNYPVALGYFNQGLELARKNNNNTQIAFCLSSMGDIHNSQKDFQKALMLYKEAYQIAVDNDLKVYQCNSLGSIGMTYFLLGEKQNALQYLNKTVDLANETGNLNKLAFAYMALGNTHESLGNADQALTFYQKSIDVASESNNNSSLANCYNQLSEYLVKLKRLDQAKINALKAYDIAKKIEIPEEIKKSAAVLSNIYEQQNNHKESLKMLHLYILMRDTISNEENIKKLASVEFQAKEQGLKAEQKTREIAYKAEQDKKEEELKRQKTIRYAFTAGFGLVLILAIVIYKNLRLNKKKNKIIVAQKKEVEHQKELVDEKNKEITDSINYAKRLQEAILPPLKLVKQYFPNSFVLYMPKDIVAGDFYWMEQSGDITFFAAADSTGHGVPGAIVSVVCSNALNRAVKEFKLTDPGMVLDKTRELVLETFEKSEGEVKDGMDVSLLCYNNKSGKISWAGANNPLWYISNGAILEIKANKQPIGKTDNPLPFTTHEIEYSAGTTFYLLTDGFADQFGGPKGKKFKYKQLEEIILNNSTKPLDEQMEILKNGFNLWKDNKEQVDDVTLIGIKI